MFWGQIKSAGSSHLPLQDSAAKNDVLKTFSFISIVAFLYQQQRESSLLFVSPP